ncbi:hypothetical protein B7700_00365 [Streptococcus mitis]|uniref:Uncharacterized protein n=1 Tax=Streptococcus mitis TaxID=28037 RepID=A0A1X1KBP9_STRMT|nr:hypothetical protein B7700_00365 [Streptococcus mitis]
MKKETVNHHDEHAKIEHTVFNFCKHQKGWFKRIFKSLRFFIQHYYSRIQDKILAKKYSSKEYTKLPLIMGGSFLFV